MCAYDTALNFRLVLSIGDFVSQALYLTLLRGRRVLRPFCNW